MSGTDQTGSVAADPSAALPDGATDTHVHVFDGARFPFAGGRAYTPGPAPLAALATFLSAHRLNRAVLVQPSVYGTDNACLLDALRHFGPARARGVAVIDPATVTDRALADLSAVGIKGFRINLGAKGEDRLTAARQAISALQTRLAGSSLFIQVYAAMALVEGLEPLLATSPVPIVLDHFAGATAAGGPAHPGMAAILRLLRDGTVWIKLSAPYRASTDPDYADLTPIAQAMMAANAERLVWASDWPHTGGGAARKARGAGDIEPFRRIDTGRTLALLRDWAGDEALFRTILARNPEHLFGFSPAALSPGELARSRS